MKNVLLSFCISLSLLFGYVSLTGVQQISAYEKVNPPYAKWGLLAVKETEKKYKGAQIIDYLHRGRQINEQSTIEKFKLWLKKENQEFGVFVNITFDTHTEEVLQISFTETDK